MAKLVRILGRRAAIKHPCRPRTSNSTKANRPPAHAVIQASTRCVSHTKAPHPRKFPGIAIAVPGLSTLCGRAPDAPPLSLAARVDLNRCAGRWYVIANFPYFAGNGNVGSCFDISLQPDGTLTDLYTAHPKNFTAPPKTFTMTGYVVPDTGNARWRESPFWPLFLSYLILYVDPDYQTALAGYPGRGYGWIFARTPVIDTRTYQSLLGRLKEQGYDIAQFRRVPQTPEQRGEPGFQ